MLSDEALLAACHVVRTRRGGPGGQHRNKVETAVVITHVPTAVRAEANERRSQAANRRVALQRLRVRLAIEVRSSDIGAGRVEASRLWRSRRRGRQLPVRVDHPDFPALLAEALDAIAAAQWDVARAAQWLGVSTTQLIGLLKRQPDALGKVNAQRQERGLRPLC